MVLAASCGRLGFSERADSDAGLDSTADASVYVGACPGSSLSCDGALACRSFEGGDLDEWSYVCDGDDYQCSPTIPEVALEVVESPACNGEKVYRAFTEGGPGTRQNAYLGQDLEDETLDKLYVRFAMRWPAATNLGETGVMIVPLLPAGSSSSPRFGFGRAVGEMRVNFLDERHYFAAPTVADQWTCIEVFLSNSSTEVWVDGVSRFNGDGPSIPSGTRFDIVTLGINGSVDEGPTEIFFDDFAISTTRIGCVPGIP